MDNEIETIDYKWSHYFMSPLVGFVCSVFILIVWYYELPIMGNFWFILILGIVGLIDSLHKIILHILSVPKRIILKQNSISIVFSEKRSKEFSYKDVSSFVIDRRGSLNGAFRTKLFFNDTYKVLIDPSRFSNFQSLVDILHNKGRSQVIKEIGV